MMISVNGEGEIDWENAGHKVEKNQKTKEITITGTLTPVSIVFRV